MKQNKNMIQECKNPGSELFTNGFLHHDPGGSDQL